MRVLLTSFGLTPEPVIGSPNGLGAFYRMPPLGMAGAATFSTPDPAILLLADSLILDTATYERLTSPLLPPLFKTTADVLISLHREGLVELCDFESLFANHASVIQDMTRRDLRSIARWRHPLEKSATIWREWVSEYYRNLRDDHTKPEELSARLTNDFGVALAHRIATKVSVLQVLFDPSFRATSELMRHELRPYLMYVNANIVSAFATDSIVHDWSDYEPFYAQKFADSGQVADRRALKAAKESELVRLIFPEFAIDDVAGFMRLVLDERIVEIRSVVTNAMEAKTSFDAEFVSSLLADITSEMRRSDRWKRAISLFGPIIDAIPGSGPLASLAVTDLVSNKAEEVAKREHAWYYLISDYLQR